MTSRDRDPAVPPTRVRVAQVLAFVALVAALIGALGPAEQTRTNYSWPPRSLPSGTPERVWHAPLLLNRHRPEALSASIPCGKSAPLPGAADQVRVLTTAREPRRAGALAVVRSADELSIAVGDDTIARLPAGEGTSEGCAYRLSLDEGRWTVDGVPGSQSLGGELETMPTVFGFFSEVDLRSAEAPRVDVRTAVHTTDPSTRQTIAWSISALASAAALWLVAVARRPRAATALRRGVGAARRHAGPVDVLVGLGITGWWVLSPAFFDDGWIYAKLRSFESSGGFSSYFVFLGTNAPLGYWLDWPQHWLAENTTSVLLLRILAALCIGATWVLCRTCFARVAPTQARAGSVGLWTLASVFLVGLLAWGMTLRPEPIAALLVTGALLATLVFLERRMVAPLAVAAVLVALAITAHPSGVLALAPLLAAAPSLVRFARAHVAEATTTVASTIALTLVLLFLGADLEQRRVEAQTISALDTATESWFDELYRYELLSVAPYSTPLRRALVALIALTLLALVLRVGRRTAGPSVLPTATVGFALLLLVPTPSKWPSHFGTMIGLVAIAAAVEMTALREWRGRPFAPFVLLGAAAVAGVWAWNERGAWNPVDLRLLDWRPAFESWLPLPAISVLLPLGLLGAAVTFASGDSTRRSAAPRRAAAWSVAIFGLPFLVFTPAVLTLDTVRTDGWTYARQTVEAAAGGSDCGLGENLRVPALERSAGTEPLARRLRREGSRTLVLPNLVTYFPCARLPDLRRGAVEVPDTIVTYPNAFSPIRYPLTSPFVGVLDLYPLRELPIEPTGDRAEGQVIVYEVDRRIPGAQLAPVTASSFTS